MLAGAAMNGLTEMIMLARGFTRARSRGNVPMRPALARSVGLSSVPCAAPALPLDLPPPKGRGLEVSILRPRKT